MSNTDPKGNELDAGELADALTTGAVTDLLGGSTVAALFSADLEPREITFRIEGAPADSVVTIRAMDADAMARYRDAISQFSAKEDESADGSGRFYIEPKTALADLALLMGTVLSGKFNYMARGKAAEASIPSDPQARIEFFRKMHPSLRARLVRECKTENGLVPK